MTKLFLTFSDGTYHYGPIFIYETGLDTPSHVVTNKEKLLSSIYKSSFIGLQDRSVYNVNSIVKIIDMTKDEYISYTRDKKLTKIFNDEPTR